MVKDEVANLITPDYTASIESVFAQATFASFQGEGKFEILCFARSITSSRDCSVPTRAMGFGKPPIRNLKNIRHSLAQYHHLLGPAPQSFSHGWTRLVMNAVLFDDLDFTMHDVLRRNERGLIQHPAVFEFLLEAANQLPCAGRDLLRYSKSGKDGVPKGSTRTAISGVPQCSHQ